MAPHSLRTLAPLTKVLRVLKVLKVPRDSGAKKTVKIRRDRQEGCRLLRHDLPL